VLKRLKSGIRIFFWCVCFHKNWDWMQPNRERGQYYAGWYRH